MAVWSVVKKSELEGARRIDAEYYRPVFKKWNKKIQKIGFEELDSIATVSYGTTPQGGVFEEQGIPFIRSQAFSLLSIDSTNLVFCSHSFHNQNLKSEVKPGDILLAAVGATIGELAIVPKDIPLGNINQNIAKVRIISHEYLPAYVSVFLLSPLGQFQIERLVTGNAQPYLNSSQIRHLRIPEIPLKEQLIWERELDHVRERIKESEVLYIQAEQLLLTELGWDKLNLNQPKWWTTSFSRAREVQRMDADHFQPKYDKLLAHLKKTGKSRPLGDFASYIKRGIQPRYVEGGDVLVINSRYVGKQLINTEQAERTDEAFWKENPRARVTKNDVIMNSTGWGTIGRTNCVFHDQKTVVDNHVTIIRTKDSVCDPTYLAVFLNSKPGLMQTDKWLSGSSGQVELYPGDIARFLIFLPTLRVQQKVADLVRQSYEARRTAKALLEEAKQKVESLIEGASKGKL